MIKNITIENFFSFGSSTKVSLDDKINLILGINGSGKTNFLKCLTLLRSGISEERGFHKQFSVEWGGFGSVSHLGRSQNLDSIKLSYEFDKEIVNAFSDGFTFRKNPKYEITIEKKGNEGGYILYEKLYNDPIGRANDPFVYLEMGNGWAVVSATEGTGRPARIKRLDSYLSTELLLSQLNDPDRYYPLHLIKKAILDISVYYNIDTSKESEIRDLSPFYPDTKLLPKGENLISLLNYLNGNSLEAYEKIIEGIRNINPHFRDLVFTQPTGGKTLLSLKENNMKSTLAIGNLSDGTIHYLILMAILYNPNRGRLVCIDEPEVGLHPNMIEAISEGIIYASDNGSQIIVATHSPFLLNFFEPKNAISFSKNEQNQTNIENHNNSDFEDETGLGQRWLNGQIGGVRW